MSIEAGLVLTGYFVFVGILFALTLVSAKRHKQRGTSIWDPPPKQPGVSANWKWLAIGLAGWALFSGGRFYTFTDEVRFETVNVDGDSVTHVVNLPNNGAIVKARFVLPDGRPAAGGLAHVHYLTPTHRVNLYQQLAASDDNGNLAITHFEEWYTTPGVDSATAYRLEFIYKDPVSNALYVHKQRFDPEGQRLFDLGEIKLGDTGHDLTFHFYLNGEPYMGRAIIRNWDSYSEFAPRLTGTGSTYRILGIPTVEEGGRTQLSFEVELLDAHYKDGRNLKRTMLVEAGTKLERTAVVVEHFRED